MQYPNTNKTELQQSWNGQQKQPGRCLNWFYSIETSPLSPEIAPDISKKNW